MRNTPITNSFCRLLLLIFCFFPSVVGAQISSTTWLSRLTTDASARSNELVDSLTLVLLKLDDSWDYIGSYAIVSKSLKEDIKKIKRGDGSTLSLMYCQPVVDYRLNTASKLTEEEINKELLAFSTLLSKPYEQFAAGMIKQDLVIHVGALRNWLDFMQYRVSDLPMISANMMYELNSSKLTPSEIQESKDLTHALLNLLSKYANTPGDPYDKLLAFKYLGMYVLSLPWVWKTVEPEFVRLAKMGGASLNNLYYNRLYMARAPSIEKDSRIWRNAPRFGPNQLKTLNRISNVKVGMTKIELSDTETILTSRFAVGGYELWYYFDKSTCIVDTDTGDRYPIISMSNNLPLSKTFVVEGCQDKIVEYTMTFPPLKKTVKSFRMEQEVTNPSEHMSDGRISQDTNVYNVGDFL